MRGTSERKKLSLPRRIKLNPVLRRIGDAADAAPVPAFLVGGTVRDFLLGAKNLDWDIAVEGNPQPLVDFAVNQWSGAVLAHPRFGTYVVDIGRGRHIDFATARKEVYPFPGILPVVEFSSLNDDLFRRDFTINTLAVALNRPARGEIIDRYGGLRDLSRRMLHILHPRSFKDDPTRIFRLARFAARGFRIEPGTKKRAAAGKRYLRYVSKARIREEIFAILSEKDPERALALLEEWGIWKRIFPAVALSGKKKELRKFDSLEERLAFLLRDLPGKRRKEAFEEFKFPRRIKRDIEAMLTPGKEKPILGGRDLISMGYAPGPLFKEILNSLSHHHFSSRREARKFVFDKFPQKG